MFDYILRGGLVYDGTGAEPQEADIGVRDRMIQAVGTLDGATGEAIDCTGLVVSPGFIDIHTHSDATLLTDPDGFSLLMQGVTTEVIGNCGFSSAPCCNRSLIERFMVGKQPDLDFTWRSFGDYLDVLEARRPGLNVAAYVGHNNVRLNVIGTDPRPAEDHEIDAMTTLVRESLEQGAIGVSSGLEYNPGFHSDLPELVAVAKVAADFDAVYASHVRNRDWNYEMGVGEALSTARLSGARLQLSHLVPKYGAPTHAAEHIMEMMDWTRRTDADVGFDIIPHEWGPTFVYSVLPKWAYEGGVPKIIERLGDPELRPMLMHNPWPQWKMVAEKRWHDMVLTQSAANPSLVGLDFAEIGRIRGKDPHDATLDLLLEEGENMANLLWVGRISRDADIRTMLREKDCGVISDAITLNNKGPLGELRFTPTGFGWTARFLGHYARDEKLLSLGEGIRRLTTLPAQRMGLKRRGAVKVGYHADLVVFDARTIADQSTLQDMNVTPAGLLHVFVNGEAAVREGKRTAARAGQVLRRQ
ncbi:amidohydrolase family protein [Vineibacter terrae]|uniref:Amidohydrolase family protein n=1 Tax=Vineibacter terrae TaxID=2586908 RepID=A0A5C8P9J0_9HYPH|nr:amidohydrolase family protein [Vineibacter terrae]TXL70437.1 amidohydrolase family protein [Vineibacter terrae]